MAVTVLLVDDDPELRAFVRRSLQAHGGFAVVGEASDGTGAVDAARRLRPEVVVLDVGLPDLAGSDVMAGIRSAAPETKVVVFADTQASQGAEAPAMDSAPDDDQDLRYLVELLSDIRRERARAAKVGLGPEHTDVAMARRFVADQCERWQCPDVVEDAQLVVTELVTNALVHAGSTCELSARLGDSVLRLEVIDTGHGVPDPQLAGPMSERGRGLLLVSALSTAWGMEGSPDGRKMVWAELAATSAGSSPSSPTRAPNR